MNTQPTAQSANQTQTQTQTPTPTDLITARKAVAMLGCTKLNGHNLRLLARYGVKPVASIPWKGHQGGVMHLVSKSDVIRAKPLFEDHQANLKRRQEEKAEKERVRKEAKKDLSKVRSNNTAEHMAMMRAKLKERQIKEIQAQTPTLTSDLTSRLISIEAKIDALLAMWESH